MPMPKYWRWVLRSLVDFNFRWGGVGVVIPTSASTQHSSVIGSTNIPPLCKPSRLRGEGAIGNYDIDKKYGRYHEYGNGTDESSTLNEA
jgi:hypothetical protein